MVGDATRASLLTSELPASGVISSVTLDRGLFMGTGLIVTIAGFAALLFMPAVPRGLRLYGSLFAVVLVRSPGFVGMGCPARLACIVAHRAAGGSHTLVESLAAK